MPNLVLVKHALPVLDPAMPPRHWLLSEAGEAQSRRLALSLRRFVPFRLVTSPEPKAKRTSELVASELGLSAIEVEGLQEIDRPALPILSPQDHERLNAPLFSDRDRPVVGIESARDALDRFSGAVLREVERGGQQDLVAISHGTVIALFAGAHAGVDPFQLWRRLQCPSYVVLEAGSLALVEVVERLP